ncbi:MAG: hypothetical protein QXR45_09995 [Candidatus Bathyarchaeia archaeon]
MEITEILKNSLEKYYPNGTIIFYDLNNQENIERLRMIMDIVDEVLYLPVIGVFENENLIVVVSGAISIDDWGNIVKKGEGVPVYVVGVNDILEVKTVIGDREKIANLSELFTKSHFDDVNNRRYVSLLWVMIISVITDMFDPCVFGAFVALMTVVYYKVGKAFVWKIGFAYTSALFIVHFLLGIVLLRVIPYVPFIKYAFAVFAWALGVLRIIENKKRHLKLVPFTIVSRISTELEHITDTKKGFIAGLSTGFLLLYSSAASYLIVVDIISNRIAFIEGALFLLFYNFVSMVPLVVIAICIQRLVFKTKDLKKYIDRKKGLISSVNGLGLILLAALALHMG